MSEHITAGNLAIGFGKVSGSAAGDEGAGDGKACQLYP